MLFHTAGIAVRTGRLLLLNCSLFVVFAIGRAVVRKSGAWPVTGIQFVKPHGLPAGQLFCEGVKPQASGKVI